MTDGRNDPTRSGFTPPPIQASILSANEVETLCLKAARGVGMSWGMAEEAGVASRWLFRLGVDGPALLLSYLAWILERGRPGASPSFVDGNLLFSQQEACCPIKLGCAMSDCGNAAPVGIGTVRQPALMLAHTAHCARLSGAPVSVSWPGGSVSLWPDGAVSGDLAALASLAEAPIQLRPCDAHEPDPGLLPVSTMSSPDILRRLNELAMRTTVPASSTSRADAGAGTADND